MAQVSRKKNQNILLAKTEIKLETSKSITTLTEILGRYKLETKVLPDLQGQN